MTNEDEPHVAVLKAWSCIGCGAPLDPRADSDGYVECEHCGHKYVDPSAKDPPPEPEIVLVRESELPLSLPTFFDEANVRGRVGKFLRGGVFSPGDLAQQAKLGALAWSLVPAWTGSVTAMSRWTAEVGKKKGDKISWRKDKGQHQHNYADMYAVAGPAVWRSGPSERAVLSAQPLFAQARRDHYLELQSDQFVPVRMSDSEAFTRIEGVVKRLEHKTCRRQVSSGQVRNFRVDTVIQERNLQLIHVPVWHGHYQYGKKQYAVYVNAATGSSFGIRPLSPKRVGIAVAIAAAVLLIVGIWVHRQDAANKADARRKAEIARLELKKKRDALAKQARALGTAPRANADRIHATIAQLKSMGDVSCEIRRIGVTAALAEARHHLAKAQPVKAATAFHRAVGYAREDSAQRKPILAEWKKAAQQSYSKGYGAYKVKSLYVAEVHLAAADALLSSLKLIVSGDADVKDLATTTALARKAIAAALKKRFNTTVRLMLFNDKDGDPWDRDGAPDPQVTVTVAGRTATLKEQVGKDRFEISAPLELRRRLLVQVQVFERDGGKNAEKVGRAQGVYEAGRPLWLKAGWAYVQVLTRAQAKRHRFGAFVAAAQRRHRADRLASWGGTIVKRGQTIRFRDSEVTIARKRRFKTHRSRPADKAFCGAPTLRAPAGGFFVVLTIRQRVLGSRPMAGLRKDRLFGGVSAALVSTTGHNLSAHPSLATCLYRGAQQITASRNPGQKWEVLIPYAVPKDTRPGDLYLQLSGHAAIGGQQLKRLKVW